MPVTPFRRTIDAVLLEHHPRLDEQPTPPGGINKWEVLRTLSAVRHCYGLSDRALSVLQALISFHHGNSLDPSRGSLIVYPSNRTICERLNGMPCSTMRRHVSRLVAVGLIVRRDSPNGKRYTRRYGGEKVAYGFDLTPLVAGFEEFCEVAKAAGQAESRLKHQREIVSLMRRDLANLLDDCIRLSPDRNDWQRLSSISASVTKALRRTPRLDELTAMETQLKEALREVRKSLEEAHSSTTDAQSEHHNQNLEKEDIRERSLDRSSPQAQTLASRCEPPLPRNEAPQAEKAEERTSSTNRTEATLSLTHVIAACPAIVEFSQAPVRRWHDLVRAADIVAPMLGISTSTWNRARSSMGAAEAATAVAVILERSTEIRSPGGYLRRLSDKACIGSFSPIPMLRSLQRGHYARTSSQL